MTRRTRPISWIEAARKAFESFPLEAQQECLRALTIAAEGERTDIVKPMQGVGAGIWEVALRHRGDAFRVVDALQVWNDLSVVHAFQTKSTSGFKTPQHEIETVRERLQRLKEALS